MSVVYKINSVDVSDYVVSSGNVPFVSRNRDWTITSDGFNFTVSDNISTAPLVGDIIEVFNNTDEEYLGIVERVIRDYTANRYNVTVAHFFKNGLNNKKVKPSLFRPYLIKTGTPRPVTAVNTTTETISTSVLTSELPSVGAFVYFTVDDVDSDTFPSPLDGITQYQIKTLSTTGISGSYTNIDITLNELGGTSTINLTGAGTNVNMGLVDKKKYVQYDSEGLPSCNVKHLMVALCDYLGFDADTTNIDSLVFASNPAGAKLDDLRMDENMLYAINQNYAVNQTYINENVEASKLQLKAFDILSELMSYFGFYLKYTDTTNRTFTFFSIPYSGTLMQLSSSPTYSLSDDVVYSKTSETVNREYDFATYTLKARGDGNDIIRSDYNNDTESTLFLTSGNPEGFIKYLYSFYYEFSGGEAIIDTTPSVDNVNAINVSNLTTLPDLYDNVSEAVELRYYNNFWIFQSALFQTVPGSTYDINPDYDFFIANFPINSGIKPRLARYCANWTTEEIETDIIDTESRILRNEINPKNQTSVITQETPSI